jgi:hypothetical protein
MATPNMPSSAQDIINNFLSGGYASEAQANPYRVDVDPFRPPESDDSEDNKPDNDPCPEGYVYDPVVQSCVPIVEERDPQEGDSDNNTTLDPNQVLFNKMKKDPTTIFGASNILSDYVLDNKDGNITLKFDPKAKAPPPIFGLGIFDLLTGGANRRQTDFTTGMQSYMDQGYGQYNNDGTYQIYTPQQYYNTVQSNPLQSYINGQKQPNITVGQAVDSVMNPTPQVYDPLTGSMRSTTSSSGGSPIAEDLTGGLLGTSPLTTVDSQGNRKRNDAVYRSNVAKNIERNKQNFGNSKFKEGFGFTGGR